jgi:nucleolar protein 56
VYFIKVSVTTEKSKITVVECIMGVFAFNEQDKVVASVFFPKKVEEVVETLERLQRGEIVVEVTSLVKRLVRRGYRELIFENEGLAKAIKEKFNIEVSLEKSSKAGDYLRSNLEKLAIDRRFTDNLVEFNNFVHEVSTAMVKVGVKEASGKRDLIVSQAVFILDDLDKTFNLFANRLREWYGYYFPELSSLVDKSDTYIKLISSLGERRTFTVDNLTELGLSSQRAETISAAAKVSMGANLGERDISEVHSLSTMLLGLCASREELERYLDDLMKEVAPNIRELVGSTLGARLIASVGSLENLSKKSSGTIQLLGAEKALFRSFKTGSRPPKHGLIFQQKDLHQSPRWQRGKIARALAGKLAIAARIDAYKGEYLGSELKGEFDKRLEEIKAIYGEPPKKGK